MDDLVETVRRSLSGDARDEFDRRVAAGAEFLRDEIADGTLATPDFAVGLELEAYAVDEGGSVVELPGPVFDGDGPAKELGVHNVEINTPATTFDAAGLAAQRSTLVDRVAAAKAALDAVDARPVLDAMWTVPHPDGTRQYFSAVEERDGVTVAKNMRTSPRYCAIDNEVLDWAGGAIPLDLPGVDRAFPTILFESLTTSMQPHLQIPDLDAYPRYYNTAIRTMGPVLSLATNSPFVPADLYATDDPCETVRESPHECRIHVFEQAINVDDGPAKVRFPGDIDRTADIVDRLVEDRVCAPFLREWIHDVEDRGTDPLHDDPYSHQFWELDHKRGTYWRWLRSVIGGDAVERAGDGRSIRIEYRPLPTQPSLGDTVGLHHLVVGLIRGLVDAGHPLHRLDPPDAEACFYDAVDRGIDADLAWITEDGDRTDDPSVVYDELLRFARRGLRDAGLDDGTIDRHLEPIAVRADERRTPSTWRKERVLAALDDGDDLPEAIESMQRDYYERVGTPFAEWD